MSDPFSDLYWAEEFQVTQADLDRIAAHIFETGQAYDLTALARRVVRGRLRHGPESSTPARPAWAEDASVRLWDPAGKWKVGDHAIVAVGFTRGDHTIHEPYVAEVVAVGVRKVRVQVDALGESKTFLTSAGDEDRQKWRQLVQDLVEARRGTRDVDTQVEYVFLEHGERVVSQILEAVRVDGRFVRLAGRWFLHELAVPPTEEQLTGLAWAMALLEEPQLTADLVLSVEPRPAEGDPGLFGLYLAMRDRPDLFENADPGQRPRWVLAGPPPDTRASSRAAYDPETYEVLCLPGEPMSPQAIRRLWDFGLLKAVL